jgi:hypothetical protein
MDIESGLAGVEESLQGLADLVKKESRALQEALEFILLEMVKYVKKNGPWLDHTSNLRNSISCNIETMQEWPAETPEDVLKSLVSKNETPRIELTGDGYQGVLSAGMDYAIWVELKDGYWVLTGAIDRFEPMLDKYFVEKMAVEKLDLIGAADIQYSKFLSKKGLNSDQIMDRIQQKHDYYSSR